MKTLLLTLALLVAAAGPAKSLPVKAEAATKHKVTAAEKFPAKAGGAVLLVSDEITGGDFPQAKVYVRASGKVYGLGAYRSIDKVKWAANGLSVTFQGNQLRDYGVDDVVQIRYTLGKSTMTRQVIGEAKDEASG